MNNERIHVFPPALERSYPVVAGRVRTRSLEAHVIDHCNLTCAECCSLSPLLPKWLATADDLARDLALARRVLAPQVFKIVGGEPTLHPHIVELLQVARASNIAPIISLTTNGLLLPKMPDAFFAALDALTISLYPTPALPAESIVAIKARALCFDVALNWKEQGQFVGMNRAQLCVDDEQNQRVYHACWLRERCHMVRDGVFFTCTRPPHFASLHSTTASKQAGNRDGLSLLGDLEAADVLAYLARPTPLAACSMCHGGSAPLGPHQQLTRAEVSTARAQLLRIMAS